MDFYVKIRGFEKVSLGQWIKDGGTVESYDTIELPKRYSANSAGYDFHSPIAFTLKAGEEIKIPTGVKVYMPSNEWIMIIPRSSMGFKYYMRLSNTLACGDSDYHDNPENEGHYWIKIRNEGTVTMSVAVGDRFAQGIFLDYLLADNDNANQERKGGLGSTNTQTEKEKDILKQLGYK